MNDIVKLKRSNEIVEGDAKVPAASDLDYGYVAINYATGHEKMFIKNDSDEVVNFPSTSALGNVFTDLTEHASLTNNPHQVTKDQVGLGNVDNTADLDKPLSNLQQQELNKKVNSSDIVDNCTTNDSTKPLSANQGVILSELISQATGSTSADLTELLQRIGEVEEELNGALELANTVISNSI